jgi:hypothetical protein
MSQREDDRFEAQSYVHDNCEEYCGRVLMDMECTAAKPVLSDIEYWEDVTHMFAVEPDGSASFEIDRSDGDFNTYHCTVCQQFFREWDEVKQHIGLEATDGKEAVSVHDL